MKPRLTKKKIIEQVQRFILTKKDVAGYDFASCVFGVERLKDRLYKLLGAK